MPDAPHEPRLSPQDEADLAAFADGRLERERRTELEARLAGAPALRAAARRQELALAAVASAREATSAPLDLRARVERLERGEGRRRRLWRPRLRWAVPAAVLAGLVASLVVPGGELQVADTLAAAERSPQGEAEPHPGRPGLLNVRVEDVRFPDWGGRLDWPATGVREDSFDGRKGRTVFYEKDGVAVAYTVLEGPALEQPDVPATVMEGVEFRTFTEGTRTAITWRSRGQTCVLSGEGVPREALLALATWRPPPTGA